MKVFISWSGKRSNLVAMALREWLPMIIQDVDPFVSQEDIAKGKLWSLALAKELEESDVGIVCCTPENQAEPWLLFESGAIAKKFDSAHVCTYLLGLETSQVKGPLAQFQHTLATEEDTRRLLVTLNSIRTSGAIDEPRLNKLFSRLWPELDDQLKKIPAPSDDAPRPKRSTEDMVAEILDRVRVMAATTEGNSERLSNEFSKMYEMSNVLQSNRSNEFRLEVEKMLRARSRPRRPKDTSADLTMWKTCELCGEAFEGEINQIVCGKCS